MSSRRLCGVILVIHTFKILLFNVYMPCDTSYDESNETKFADVLNEISIICNKHDVDQVIIGGDFNTDFFGNASLHSITLNSFFDDESMRSGLNHILSNVKYT